jgi:hypothetical protein
VLRRNIVNLALGFGVQLVITMRRLLRASRGAISGSLQHTSLDGGWVSDVIAGR